MKSPATVKAYLAAVPPPARKHLAALRELVRAVAPDAEEKVSYGLLAYCCDGPLVYLGGYAKHVALYGGRVMDDDGPLAKYLSGRGTLRFELDEPLPGKASLRALVKTRLAENRARRLAREAKKKTRRARR